jgi:hypothetical protein
MDARTRRLVEEVGGDPADEVWAWFLERGPHGPDFTFAVSRSGPPGFRGIDLLRKIIDERCHMDPQFVSRALTVARAAVGSENSELLRRAVQVLSVVGAVEDLASVESLATHPDPHVANDAKASLFALRRAKST